MRFSSEWGDHKHDAIKNESKLWDAATDDTLMWSHEDWQAGDLLMWDNRCTMHARSPVDHSQARVLHRTLIKGDPVISAWDQPSAAAE